MQLAIRGFQLMPEMRIFAGISDEENYKSILRPRASRWLASAPSSLSDLPSVAARMMLAFPQNLSEI
jgi:hypothetical protein